MWSEQQKKVVGATRLNQPTLLCLMGLPWFFEWYEFGSLLSNNFAPTDAFHGTEVAGGNSQEAAQ